MKPALSETRSTSQELYFRGYGYYLGGSIRSELSLSFDFLSLSTHSIHSCIEAMFFWGAFAVLAVLCALLRLITSQQSDNQQQQQQQSNSPSLSARNAATPASSFKQFQRNFLLIYFIVMGKRKSLFSSHPKMERFLLDNLESLLEVVH